MYRFQINKMHCKSCFLNIEDALKEADENAQMSADFDTHVLQVMSDIPKERLVELIENAGYPVDKTID